MTQWEQECDGRNWVILWPASTMTDPGEEFSNYNKKCLLLQYLLNLICFQPKLQIWLRQIVDKQYPFKTTNRRRCVGYCQPELMWAGIPNCPADYPRIVAASCWWPKPSPKEIAYRPQKDCKHIGTKSFWIPICSNHLTFTRVSHHTPCNNNRTHRCNDCCHCCWNMPYAPSCNSVIWHTQWQLLFRTGLYRSSFGCQKNGKESRLWNQCQLYH